MPSRRDLVGQYYRQPTTGRQQFEDLQKSAAAAASGQFGFRGEGIHNTVVVRIDINGYSKWAMDKNMGPRVVLLDDFFTKAVAQLGQHSGVYFRDEGDCFVCLFSDYFANGASQARVLGFCQAIGAQDFGPDHLTAKVTSALGKVAFFQKAHEAGTEDWSAEGAPFVSAARLEQAVESKQRLYFFADEYDTHYQPSLTIVGPGQVYHWEVTRPNVQISGMGVVGGWKELVCLEYVPGGRVRS